MANRIYAKTEESGFGDPLIGNDDNFDILQYIGASDTPEGSPATFCGVNNHVIYQHQQQQLLNVAASELVQALQAPGPLQQMQHKTSVDHSNAQQRQQQQPMALDNVRLIMYSNNNEQHGAPVGGGVQQKIVGQQHGRGQARLPESPPITDLSGGGSSISPGSSACDSSSSPFSPDHYQYTHPQMNGGGGIITMGGGGGNGGVQLQHREDILLANQMGQMMAQRGGGLLHRGISGDGTECMHSPNSEFLSPYPPSQPTPGSQHSSQVSPPAISHQNKGVSYLLQSTQPAMSSMSGSFASMDNLYTASTNANGSNETDMCQQQQHSNFNQPHGQKRRRMSSSATPSSNESLPLANINNNGNLPNIKSEIGTTQVNNESIGINVGRIKVQAHQPDPQQQQQRMLLQAQQRQQSFEDLDENLNSQRTIKFEPYLRDSWNLLYGINQQPLPIMPVAVVADKGFNYSSSDNCFVNQKKNHFQITINIAIDPAAASSPTSSSASPTLPMNGAGHLQALNPYTPYYVRVQGTFQPILQNEFYLGFCGVKSEMQTSEIKIKQSQADRKPIDHEPEGFKLDGSRPSVRQTVARLHFGETTMNNHRKNGKPNPEQKYFLLVVKLLVKTPLGLVLVQAFHSDRVIVRASNPGQFEQPDQELNWQRGQNGSLAFPGQVCIGTEKPIGDAQLTVHGNIGVTGNVTRPSDRRVKEDIADICTTEAMSRVAQMRLVEFAYKPEIAERWGLSENDRHRVGVIAQELAEVLPEAVKDNGEFLTVDDTRIFYDTVAAAQELYRLTGNLECKIDQVEKISQKLARYAQKRKQLGSMASGLSDFSMFYGAKNALSDKQQNCVSYSRTSLTSLETTTNNSSSDYATARKRTNGKGRDQRSDRHFRNRSYSSASAYCSRSPFYGQQPNAALCNSKFTQGTIVALVMIMALCLVTMCTLYVLDWYNRTFLHPTYMIPHMHGKPDFDPEKGPGKMYEEIGWQIPKEQNVPPLAVFCSSYYSLIDAPFTSCPHYCCPNDEKFGDKTRATGMDTLVVLKESYPSEDLSALTNGVKIEVLNLNVSIDARYCDNCDARNGIFNLFVPIAENLPTIPLQLKFSADDPTLFVEGCGSLNLFDYKSCPNRPFADGDQKANKHIEDEELQDPSKQKAFKDPEPSSHKVTENIFEVSAGSFLKSAYRFRVGHSTNLCQQDKRQRGRLFDEFNLIFYRTCVKRLEEQEQQTAGGKDDVLSTFAPSTELTLQK